MQWVVVMDSEPPPNGVTCTEREWMYVPRASVPSKENERANTQHDKEGSIRKRWKAFETQLIMDFHHTGKAFSGLQFRQTFS